MSSALNAFFRSLGGVDLDLRSGGTFARSSEGSYLTAAPNTAGSFLAYASSGTRRSAEDRGDGLGIGYLSEKSATNYVPTNQAISSSDWTNTGDVTTNQHAGPDGLTLADRVAHAIAAYGPRPSSNVGPAGQIIASVWVRAVTGTSQNQFFVFHNSGGTGLKAHNVTTTTTYQRNEVQGNATANCDVFVSDGRDLAGLGTSGGVSAHAEDNYFDLVQLEAGFYPTSAIRNTGSSTATRAADTLSYATGQFPAAFLTSGMVIKVAPDASSADLCTEVGSAATNGPDWRLVQYGGADCVRMYGVKLGSYVTVELIRANTVIASLNITFSRFQALTITAKPSAGTLTVSGATTGNGTASGTGGAWAGGGSGIVRAQVGDGVPTGDGAGPSDTLYVGGDAGGTSNVTGRYLDARGLGLIPCIQVAP